MDDKLDYGASPLDEEMTPEEEKEFFAPQPILQVDLGIDEFEHELDLIDLHKHQLEILDDNYNN